MKNFMELLDYVCISAGMALAASCYMILGQLYEATPAPWVPLAIVCAGVFCIFVANSVAQLAATYPSSLGIRTYFNAAFGKKVSFFLVVLYLCMVVLAAGVEASIVKFLLTPLLGSALAPAVVLVVFLAVIVVNLRGLEAPRTFQIAATVCMVVFGFGLGVSAQLSHADLPAASAIPAMPAFEAKQVGEFVGTVALSVFLFMGFEWVTPLGRSPAAYARKIPFSMVAAIVVLIAMYVSIALGLNNVYHGSNAGSLKPPHLMLGVDLFGPTGAYFAVCLSMLAMLTSFNAGLMGAARIVYSMAREDIFPKPVARVSLNTGAPIGAIAIIGLLSVASASMMFVEDFPIVAAVVVSAIASCIYGLLILASIVVGRKNNPQKRRFSSLLPTPLQWLCGVLMPLLGIAAIASATNPAVPAVLLTLMCFGCAALLLSVRRSL